MRDKYLRELAAAGGLCERCGGVHIPRIDEAILAQVAGLPICNCDTCPRCEKVRAALTASADDDEADDQEGGTGHGN